MTTDFAPRESLGLRCAPGRLQVLDQRLLPDTARWIDVGDVPAMVDAMRGLAVRGAPLLGVAAALCLAHRAHVGDSVNVLDESARALRAARPTAVNLMHAVDRCVRALAASGPAGLVAEALALHDEDVALCEAMAAQGAPLLADGGGVITHCNTGGLATVGIGTALGVIRRAWERGAKLHVYVDETRPLLQGGRLTAWELARLDIPYTLMTDSMAALVLRDGRARVALVGADRVARNGDFANKVGTYGLAALARFHGADFYPVAPWTTVDLACPDGAAIPIEGRDAAEVRGVVAGTHHVRWAPEAGGVFNPAFDVTPASLVTALVLDRAVVSAATLRADGLASLA
jgi:methylthioribose-1-phosphate isomerase